MSGEEKDVENQGPHERQPVFLLPGIVAVIGGLLLAIHFAATLLDPRLAQQLTLWFGYIPLRIVAGFENPPDWVPLLWTPFTHALLHANWEHVLINTAWFAIFATPVARRYGARPTLVIFLVSAAAGALAFTITSLYDGTFLVGASGGVAGLTGAAVRFIFQPVVVATDPETGERIALGRRLASMSELLANPRSRFFTLVWVILNAAVPLLPAFTGGGTIAVAWQAHLGGFFAGLLLVPFFERRG